MGTPNAKAAERKRVLQERKRERQAQLQLQLDEWFERFDEDHNNSVDFVEFCQAQFDREYL